MPLLAIPSGGLTLGSPGKASRGPPDVIRLTLNDDVIEDMIKCVRQGEQISLQLGTKPALNWGSSSQRFATSIDPFTTDLYRSAPPPKVAGVKSTPSVDFVATVRPEKFRPTTLSTIPASAPAVAAPTSAPNPSMSTADAALAALQSSLAVEDAKKKDKNTKLIKNGVGFPTPVSRGHPAAKPTAKSRLLAQKNASRSMSASPNMLGPVSPAVAPTIPLSQQQAEKTKAVRRPIIHELALGPATEEALFEKADCSKEEFLSALDKVADKEDGKYKLRNKAWKDLDVWNYDYASENDRTTAIENAVRVYDKMRLNASEPEWDRLLHKSERGKGKSLSKLQAKIAEGPKPKVREDSEHESDAPKAKGEPMARSSSQQAKPKKMSEKDAQAKRLLSKPGKVPKTAAPASTPAPAPKPKDRKPAAVKEDGKFKSSQFVSESDDEPNYVLAKSPSKADKVERAEKTRPTVVKRPREEDASDNGVHTIKKAKKLDHGPTYTSTSTRDRDRDRDHPRASYSAPPVKKNNSPQKSSPLASSPPTNASDINDSYNTSSSTSPLISQTKVTTVKRAGAGNIHADQPIKRHQKNASSTSSLSSVGSYSVRKPSIDTLDLARKFKAYYSSYATLHRELSADPEPSPQKLEELLDMHNRLRSMKKKIIDACN